MAAVVGPGAPIVIGLAFDIFTVLVVQKFDYRVQHGLGYGKPSAKDRSGKLQRQIGADACPLQKVAQLGVRRGTREAVEGDPLVDALGDRLLLDSLEAGKGQPFARCEAAGKDQFVTRRRHPIDVLEHLVDAYRGSVLRVLQARWDPVAPPQLRE